MARFVRIGTTLIVNLDHVLKVEFQDSSKPRVLISMVGDASFSIRKEENPGEYAKWKKMIESQPDIIGEDE